MSLETLKFHVFKSRLCFSPFIAHQFFGNAITCEWWNYVWIQEGLATVFEYLTPEAVLPQYRMKHLFNLQLQNGLRVDADEMVRPMTNVVDTNEQLPGLFDRIAYDKCKIFVTSFYTHKSQFFL